MSWFARRPYNQSSKPNQGTRANDGNRGNAVSGRQTGYLQGASSQSWRRPFASGRAGLPSPGDFGLPRLAAYFSSSRNSANPGGTTGHARESNFGFEDERSGQTVQRRNMSGRSLFSDNLGQSRNGPSRKNKAPTTSKKREVIDLEPEIINLDKDIVHVDKEVISLDSDSDVEMPIQKPRAKTVTKQREKSPSLEILDAKPRQVNKIRHQRDDIRRGPFLEGTLSPDRETQEMKEASRKRRAESPIEGQNTLKRTKPPMQAEADKPGDAQNNDTSVDQGKITKALSPPVFEVGESDRFLVKDSPEPMQPTSEPRILRAWKAHSAPPTWRPWELIQQHKKLGAQPWSVFPDKFMFVRKICRECIVDKQKESYMTPEERKIQLEREKEHIREAQRIRVNAQQQLEALHGPGVVRVPAPAYIPPTPPRDTEDEAKKIIKSKVRVPETDDEGDEILMPSNQSTKSPDRSVQEQPVPSKDALGEEENIQNLLNEDTQSVPAADPLPEGNTREFLEVRILKPAIESSLEGNVGEDFGSADAQESTQNVPPLEPLPEGRMQELLDAMDEMEAMDKQDLENMQELFKIADTQSVPVSEQLAQDTVRESSGAENMQHGPPIEEQLESVETEESSSMLVEDPSTDEIDFEEVWNLGNPAS